MKKKKTAKESIKIAGNTKKIIAGIFIALFVLTLLKQINKPKPLPVAEVPVKEQLSEYRLTINGVSVRDFTKGVDNPDKQPFITLSRTKDYHVFYISDQDVFFISIVSYPFNEYRAVAEEDFIDKLEITKAEACELKVSVTTPTFANPEKAGKEYKLSFCE